MKESILDIFLSETRQFSYDKYIGSDVQNALKKDTLNINDFGALLSPAAETFLEKIAIRAKINRLKHFGNSVNLYTPLYLSNHCENQCIYCGFNTKNEIKRGKLTFDDIEKEFIAISNTGLKEILLLTGEDRNLSDIHYISNAVKLAKKYFTTIGLEIYPLQKEEYELMVSVGADFVSIYQETYNTDLYSKIHISGPKKDFEFRFDSQERAIQGGMRGVSFGVLFGLGDFRCDAFSTGLHAFLLQKNYPHAEISISVPRLKDFHGMSSEFIFKSVTEKNLLQAILALRIFLPFAAIAISTRERASFRDNVVSIAATKISAEVKTSVGGHFEKKGDEQFNISDSRNVLQIHNALLNKNLQPVYTDYIAGKAGNLPANTHNNH